MSELDRAGRLAGQLQEEVNRQQVILEEIQELLIKLNKVLGGDFDE